MAEKIKIDIEADGKTAQAELDKTTASVENTAKAADKASFSFKNFALSSVNVVTSLVSISVNLARLAANYLGLTVEIETSNKKLKIFNFFVQNTRKEITLSLSFLNKFADYLRKIEFPINRLIQFIDLVGDFRVKIGIGQGENTIFEHAADGIKAAAIAAKDFKLSEFRQEIRQAITSLVLFGIQAAATFKSLKEGVAREAAFSQASRTINGTTEDVKSLKTEIDKLAATDLAVPAEELYRVAGVAGAMGMAIKEIPQFLKTVSEGAIALDIPASDLAEKLGTIQTQLDLTAEGVVSFSDQVNSVADTMPGKVRELDVFEVLSMGVATAGKNFGLLKGETIALVSSLLSLGEAPETARTAIVNLLSSLQNAKNQTSEFQKGLEMMGTSAEKLAADIQSKPLPTLQSLLERMNGLSKAARLDLATKFLGKGQDAIALAKLVDNVDLFKQALKTATDETIYSGSVHAAYVKQIETVDAKITLLKNSFDNFTESLTTTFLPAISNVIDIFRSLSNALTEFSQNNPVLKTLSAITLSILSVAGALRLLKFGINAIGALFGFGIAQGGILAAVMSKLRLAITGVVGIWATFNSAGIMAVITAIRAGSAFVALRTILLALFGGTIGLVIGGLTLLFTGISNLLPVTIKWGETTTTVGQALKAVFDVIAESVTEAIAAVTEFLGLDKALVKFKTVAESVKEVFSGDWLEFDGVVAVFEEFVNVFIRGWQLIGARTAQMAERIGINIDFIKDVYNAMFDESTVEQAQLKRQKALLRNEQYFSDEMTRIMSNNPMANFKGNVESRLITNRTLAKPDERAADTGKTPEEQSQEVIDAAKKQADLVAQIEKENRDKRITDLRTEEAEKIRLIENSGKTQKQIDDDVFKAKLESGRKLYNELKAQLAKESADLKAHADGTKKLDNDQLTAKKATLKEIQSAYKQNIDNLNALEQQHRDKVKAINDEIKGLKKSEVDGLREIARQAMSETQLAADKELEIEQKTAQVRQLLNQGEYQQAAELSKELNGLALEQAKAKAAAAKETGDTYAVTQAQYEYQQSLRLTNEALNAQKTAEQQKADAAAAQAEIQRRAYENVGNQIQALNETLTTGAPLKLVLDTTELDAFKTQIEQTPVEQKVYFQAIVDGKAVSFGDIGSMVEKSVKGKFAIVEYGAGSPVNPAQGFATGGFVGGTGTGDTVPAMLTPNEYVLTVPETKMLKGMGFFNWLKSPKQKFSTGGFVKTSSLSSPTLSSGNKTTSGETFNLNLNLGNQTVAATVDKQNFDILKSLSTALEKQSRVTR